MATINFLHVRSDRCRNACIPEGFNERMTQKYNSNIIFSFDDAGRLLFNGKSENVWSNMDFETLAKILLDMSDTYGNSFVGNFSYTTDKHCENIHGIAYIFGDHIVNYQFEIDRDCYSEKEIDKVMTKTVIMYQP